MLVKICIEIFTVLFVRCLFCLFGNFVTSAPTIGSFLKFLSETSTYYILVQCACANAAFLTYLHTVPLGFSFKVFFEFFFDLRYIPHSQHLTLTGPHSGFFRYTYIWHQTK